MNDTREKSRDSYRAFQLLNEIATDQPLSQRELSRRMGIALGLVNSYLKNLVTKGYVRIKAFPRNRYGYLLTPKGIAEKSRLAYEHLSYFTNLYRLARQDYLGLFRTLESSGVRSVSFCGIDETAEIAYLSLGETTVVLADVMDDSHAGQAFFGRTVSTLNEGLGKTAGCIVITSLKRQEEIGAELLSRGIDRNRIFNAGTELPNLSHTREEQ
ncbi:MAG: winged helix-turn-helix transcriptional regulator [Geobacteraceae bacterium]|nr:winged helix-turn-helix transcriptional regulator [Geobacteraceae bacterium]